MHASSSETCNNSKIKFISLFNDFIRMSGYIMSNGNLTAECNERHKTRCYGTSELLSLYVEIKCQLDATVVFIADLIACSTCFGHHYVHHQELKSIIQWLLPVVFRAVVFRLLVWCGAEGYVFG